MIKLADRHVVQVVPVGHPVVSDVEPAVAADDHVPAVLRVDPEGVLVRVDAVAAVLGEGLAAVLGPVQLHATYVQIIGIVRIDADATEVHRSRVQAVDAGPGFAAVGGLVNAPVLVRVRTLLVLHVRLLPAVHVVVRPRCGARARAKSRGGPLQGHGVVLRFLLAHHARGDFVAGLQRVDDRSELFARQGRFFLDALDNVANLEAGGGRATVGADLDQFQSVGGRLDCRAEKE